VHRRLQRASQAQKVLLASRRPLLAPMENFPRRLSLNFRRRKRRQLKSREEQQPLMMTKNLKVNLRMRKERNPKQQLPLLQLS